MSGPLIGALMVVVAALIACAVVDSAERRRLSCDGCRVEALGSRVLFIAHSCSKRRAHYRDRRGRVFMFGRAAWRIFRNRRKEVQSAINEHHYTNPKG